MNFKVTAISAITIYLSCVFYKQATMFVYGSIEDHMFDFLTGFFFLPHKKCFLYVKNEFVENNSVNF